MDKKFKKLMEDRSKVANLAIKSQQDSDTKKAEAMKVVKTKFCQSESILFEYVDLVKPLAIDASVVFDQYRLKLSCRGVKFEICKASHNYYEERAFLILSSNNNDIYVSSGYLDDALIMSVVKNWPKIKEDLERALLDQISKFSAMAIENAKCKSAEAEECAIVAKVKVG